jgi:hypothetical protein
MSGMCSLNPVSQNPPAGQQVRLVLVALCIAALLFVPLRVAADEVLSKSLVTKTFSTSFSDWSVSLRESYEMGDAKIAVNGTYNWTQLSLTSIGILKITPEYLPNQLKRPKRLRVSVEENQAGSNKTLQLTDEQLLSIIASFQKAMLPEYSVTTIIDLIGGVSQYHFTLYEVGQNPPMDRVAIETKGCWQQCIRR